MAIEIQCVAFVLFIHSIFTLIQFYNLELEFFSKFSSDIAYQYSLSSISSEQVSLNSTCPAFDLKFTEEEYKHIYNYRNYSSCKINRNDSVSFTGNKITAKCANGRPFFSVDPGLPQKLGGIYKEKVVFSFSPDLKENSEYAFISCSKKIYALFFLRFNKTVSEQANQIRRSQDHDTKPMNVLLLVIDKLSRFTSYKYMPKITEFMRDRIKNSKKYSDFSAYEFTRIGLKGIVTIPNMAQVLYGLTHEEIQEYTGGVIPNINQTSALYNELQKNYSIWNYYKKLGYVTMFTVDTVHDYLAHITGRQISADHVFLNFWRSAWTMYGVNSLDQGQKCFGSQNSHNLTLGYTYEFFEKYRDNNKFAYVHLNSAHEGTGNVQTIDEDLLGFLKSLLSLMNNRNENLLLYIMSDHGYRLKTLVLDVRSFYEELTPLTYILLSKRVEKNLKAEQNLIHNSQMLSGRFDTNFLLKYIAHYPYDMPGQQYFEGLRSGYSVSSVVNFLTERIPYNRTCSDIKVDDFLCNCNGFKKVNMENSKIRDRVMSLLSLIDRYFSFTYNMFRCIKIRNFVLTGAEHFKVRSGRIFFNIYVTANEKSKVKGHIVCVDKLFLNNYMAAFKEGDRFPFGDFNFGKTEFVCQLSKFEVLEGCLDGECIC